MLVECQILTSKVGSRTERVNIFLLYTVYQPLYIKGAFPPKEVLTFTKRSQV